ncbi:PGF-pre-PGF domain-containing protein [Methanosarcina sp.]|uniref:PGF-pre-PGF domain-containing protein n=1 Tax=Methanosarcina sp. TaxID=2213 RepID=UPI003C76803C
MTEINGNKGHRGHNLLKVLGITVLALIMLVSIVSAEPSPNITFVTTGSSFSPVITVTGNPAIQWTFGNGSTSNSASPTVNFGSEGTRVTTLVVTPWSAVTKINIGYDGADGGEPPGSGTIAALAQQNVIAVSGLENVAPYLQVWASNYNPVTALDFRNFTALHTVECFSCRSLATIGLRNVPSLARLCVEQSNISHLDLSEAPALADLRGASQRSSTYTINWGTTGANIWHICVRDNPQIKTIFPFSQFPLLRDFYNWNDNQSGTLHLNSTNLKSVLSANNYYSAAVFSGCFPAGRNGVVEIQNNNLRSLDISNNSGLLYLNASFNSLNQTAVDSVLQTLDSYNTDGGSLDLTGNAAPSITRIAHANNLTTRDWEVKVSSNNNPPVANFTSNVTSGTVPLAVQFNDISINNPATWLWDFGDGTYSTEEFPEHIYLSPGNYTVTLTVRNSSGFDFKVVVITVLEQPGLPVANFRSNVIEGYVPLYVQFYDLSENIAERYWNFGDGTGSTEINPVHTYSVAGTYTVNLTVSNGNGTASKIAAINVLTSSSSSGGTSGGSSHSSSGGGGGAGGSPEPARNVQVKELSQAFITNGKSVKFDFAKNATCVVYVSFDAKKNLGKTTTIAEMLKGKSALVSELPNGEVYKSFNIWVGNGGIASSKNIENLTVCFKVEKSWIEDKKIDPASIILNRYSEEKWEQLPVNLSEEDDKFLYFTAKTPEFSSFAITGKAKNASEGAVTEAQLEADNGTIIKNDSKNYSKNDTLNKEPETGQKGISSIPGFKTVCGITGLLAVFLYKRE